MKYRAVTYSVGSDGRIISTIDEVADGNRTTLFRHALDPQVPQVKAALKAGGWRHDGPNAGRARVRREIATAALQGMLSSPPFVDRFGVFNANKTRWETRWAEAACDFADALLDKLEEGPHNTTSTTLLSTTRSITQDEDQA